MRGADREGEIAMRAAGSPLAAPVEWIVQANNTPRLDAIQSPFALLRELLDGVRPKLPPIDLALGEPRGAPPPFLMEKLFEDRARFANYPAIRGDDRLRTAIAGWLARRYEIDPGRIEPARHILPLNGSREGLFYATLAAVDRWRGGHQPPAVLMPNPSYAAYRVAALMAHAEPVLLPTGPETGHLPDLAALRDNPALLARAALLVLCSPSNPEGAVATRAYLAAAADLARAHGFMLFVDECYSEIYPHDPPPSALQAALGGDGWANVVVFNSLSKRSNVPGLRSGFCAGDTMFLDRLAALRNVVGPSMPGPIQHASASIWDDEAHVELSRADFRAKLALARQYLGHRPGFRLPDGGFFLWLRMGPGRGAAAALALWRERGLRLLPGAFMALPTPTGANPGGDYVRLALVQDTATIHEALHRLASAEAVDWRDDTSVMEIC
jgi:N-succinyldiaminopimelate aminotransferase